MSTSKDSIGSDRVPRSSNGVEIDLDELQAKAKTFAEYCGDKVNELFEDNIPIDDIKELPNLFWRRVLGAIACGVMLGVFIFFVYSSYHSETTQQFISLQYSPSTCSIVNRPLTGTFLMSTSGKWEGQEGFDYNLALYSVQFTNLEASPSDFKAYFVDRIAPNLQYTATNLMSQLTLAENLIYLQTVIFNAPISGSLQVLEFTPEPGFVYKREYTYIYFASWPPNYCEYFITGAMDSANSIIVTDMNVDVFYEYCGTGTDLTNLGYSQYNLSSVAFGLSFDMISFATVVALNLGYRNLSSLEYIILPDIEIAGATWEYDGVQYTVAQYYDPAYPGMQPVLCIQPTSLNGYLTFCMVRIGGYFFLPTTNSYGGLNTSNGSPDFCNCSTPTGQSSYCNLMNFLNGYIYLAESTDDFTLSVNPLIDMVKRYAKLYGSVAAGYLQLNRDAYPLSFYSVNGPYFEYSEATMASAYEFCGFNCSMIVQSVNDPYTYAVSSYYYQLSQGSCSSSLFSSTNWDALGSNPPTSLSESYYSCVKDSGSALFDAFGISVGNASLAVQVFGLLALPLIYFALQYVGLSIRATEYSKDELQRATEILALHLLRATDGKTRGLARNGILVKLASEIVKAEKSVGGMPDSDDEQSDEEEDDDGKDKEKHVRRSSLSAKRVSCQGKDSDDEEDDDDAAAAAPTNSESKQAAPPQGKPKIKRLSSKRSMSTNRQSTSKPGQGVGANGKAIPNFVNRSVFVDRQSMAGPQHSNNIPVRGKGLAGATVELKSNPMHNLHPKGNDSQV